MRQSNQTGANDDNGHVTLIGLPNIIINVIKTQANKAASVENVGVALISDKRCVRRMQ